MMEKHPVMKFRTAIVQDGTSSIFKKKHTSVLKHSKSYKNSDRKSEPKHSAGKLGALQISSLERRTQKQSKRQHPRVQKTAIKISD